MGTNEEGLNRIIGGSDKVKVLKISEKYFKKYGSSLQETLKSELSGDYLQACLAWIEPPSFCDGYIDEVDLLWLGYHKEYTVSCVFPILFSSDCRAA